MIPPLNDGGRRRGRREPAGGVVVGAEAVALGVEEAAILGRRRPLQVPELNRRG